MPRRISLVALFWLLALPASSLAQATRTWVSGVGDDANPCSRTAPCKTFAGAYAKTDVGGEIDALDPGGFGALTITHSITIDGGGGQVASIEASGADAIVVAAGAGDHVILRNLRLLGSATSAPSPAGLNGISFQSGGSLRVENVQIFGFADSGVSDTSSSASSSLVVSGSTIDDGAGDGVLVAPPSGASAQALLENDALENNECGVAAGAFGATGTFTTHCGLADSGTAASGVSVSVSATSASSNADTGVMADGSPSTVYLSNATVFGNSTGLAPLNGGAIVSAGSNNLVYGNASNGSPTATIETIPSGAPGAPGSAGQPGKVILVSCQTIVKKVKVRGKHKKHKTKIKKVRKCTARPVNGTLTFTVG